MYPSIRSRFANLFVLAALWTVATSPAAWGQERKVAGKDEVVSKADAYLAAQAKVNQFSGAVLVAQGDQVLLSKGVGLANVEHDVPNLPHTKFRLGSITKQFTAMAIMLLAEQKKLAVDDLVSKYVSGCPEGWNGVTIHHLLSHTSGIPSFTGLPSYRETMVLPSTPAKTLNRVRDMKLEFTPGEKFAYSNSGYVLLGQVIEEVSGQAYGDFLRDHVFEPLGMHDSGYDDPEKILKHRAAGYRPGAAITNAAYLNMTVPHAAGALYSTVEDLHRWSLAVDAGKLLSVDAYKKMFTPVKDKYAYGWFGDEQFGRPRVHHGGGINGFATQIVRFPGERVCVVVLSNSEAGTAGVVARDLTALLFGESYKVPEERHYVSVEANVLDAYRGEYEFAPGRVLTVSVEGNRLLGRITGQPQFELRAESETRFFVKEVGAEVTFVKSDDGKVTHLELKQGGRSVEAKRGK